MTSLVGTLTLTTFLVAPPVASPRLPELRAELLQMMKVDQDARIGFFQAKNRSEAIKAVLEIDRKNTKRMREIIAKHGWPGRTLVGKDGARAAWLLVQHADQNRPFQKECLALMQKCPPGEVGLNDLAYLIDRVLVGEGKPQRYGSQLMLKDGKLQPAPLEDPTRIDQRRKEMGMMPLAEYIRFVEQSEKEFRGKDGDKKKP